MYDDHLVASFPPLTIYIRLTNRLFVLPLRNEVVPTLLVCRNVVSESKLSPYRIVDHPPKTPNVAARGSLTSLLELHASLPEL
jgi:hypothetical protein